MKRTEGFTLPLPPKVQLHTSRRTSAWTYSKTLIYLRLRLKESDLRARRFTRVQDWVYCALFSTPPVWAVVVAALSSFGAMLGSAGAVLGSFGPKKPPW